MPGVTRARAHTHTHTHTHNTCKHILQSLFVQLKNKGGLGFRRECRCSPTPTGSARSSAEMGTVHTRSRQEHVWSINTPSVTKEVFNTQRFMCDGHYNNDKCLVMSVLPCELRVTRSCAVLVTRKYTIMSTRLMLWEVKSRTVV
jgi:hypothetical protein